MATGQKTKTTVRPVTGLGGLLALLLQLLFVGPTVIFSAVGDTYEAEDGARPATAPNRAALVVCPYRPSTHQAYSRTARPRDAENAGVVIDLRG